MEPQVKGDILKQMLSNQRESPEAMLLKGKRALITGATSGIGKAIALVFAKHGADVAIIGRNIERAQSVAKEVEEIQRDREQKVWVETIDVANKEEVSKSVKRLLELWKGVDILVNCAGITRDNLFMKMEEEEWDLVIATNLKSVYNLCRATVRSMVKARFGKIINITSVIGLTGNPGQVNYAASKSGIIGLTKSLAKELAKKLICVNCIAPGFIQTPMTDELKEKQRESILQRIPMGRLGEAEEIAHAALFLASDLSNYITGQVLTVDGGMLA